ncbi:unnamed protein product [Rhizoctonia solani]|uniref:Uncharacterized protein n=1 Tax=Rhizoctonia solani TaxID=456999 RepID=A0A8H3E5L2_9AGAM|nr:unnamed protein product [Rhizoctonia solani]
MNTRIYFTDVLTPDNIGQLPPKKNRVLKSKVPVSHLTLSDEQHTAITEAYKTPNNPSITDIQFGNDDQAEAHRLLLAHKLGAESLEHPASKWSTQWSNGESRETYKHTLLQWYIFFFFSE